MAATMPDRPCATCLQSGPPWNVSLTIEADGADYACRVFRDGSDGRSDSGAIARARWHGDRAVSRRSSESGSRTERRVAVDTAHRLCKGTRQDITCVVDLCLDGRTEAEAEAIGQASGVLAEAMACCLAEQRIRTAMVDPDGLQSRLQSPAADGLELKIDALLATPLDDLLAEHGSAIAEAHATRLDSRVLIFAPLYLSNACMNDCTYCGFRKSAKVERCKLSPEQAVLEATCMAEQGHRTLDLVTGEIPTDSFIDYVCDVCTQILEHSPIERINLNLGALSDGQYRRLRSAGASSYHLYQETYDPDVYLTVHRSGPKRDMANRLQACRRALRAGFEGIGLGILLGLAPVRNDLARLARHAHLLLREFPGTHLGFSLPRIQDAGQEPGFVDAAGIDDETFTKAFLFLRLEFPDAHLTLTTRESPEMRDRLLRLGASKISAGVSTSPGGYVDEEQRGNAQQFSIRDERSLGEIAGRVRAAGLMPTFQ